MRSPEPGASGAALAHAAFDALVDGHPPVMVRASTIAEELEEVLDPRDERSSISALEALITLRRDLLAFRRLAVAKSEILRRLARVSRRCASISRMSQIISGKPWTWPTRTGTTSKGPWRPTACVATNGATPDTEAHDPRRDHRPTHFAQRDLRYQLQHTWYASTVELLGFHRGTGRLPDPGRTLPSQTRLALTRRGLTSGRRARSRGPRRGA